MAISTAYNKPVIPTEVDAKISQQSSRILASYLTTDNTVRKLKVVEDDGSEKDVAIPAAAFHLLVDILSQMAQGNALTLIPIHAELTTQEAADLLNVSRPFLINLINSGEIPCRKVGRHRRIRCTDLISYKQNIDERRREVLNELTAQAQELNMGYD